MIKNGDYVYYAQIMPKIQTYEVIELKIRVINKEKKYFVGVEEKTKKSYLFSLKELENNIFKNRSMALEKVRLAEAKYEY